MRGPSTTRSNASNPLAATATDGSGLTSTSCVHFTLDEMGDVYLTGRLPLSSVSADDIDRLLGCVLSYSDENFDAALELGFGSAIRREWAWRVKRGESLANLQAFARFADPDR